MKPAPALEVIETNRLTLEPLTVQHANEMVEVLRDGALYLYTGGDAPTLEDLQRRYAQQSAAASPDGNQWWVNLIVRIRTSSVAIGFVQATIDRSTHPLRAQVAWVIAPEHQRSGFATEAARAMIAWLKLHGVLEFVANIHPDNTGSTHVAANLGFHATADLDDGEIVWRDRH